MAICLGVKEFEPKREINIRFAVDIMVQVNLVVNHQRAGLFKILQRESLEKNVRMGVGAREKTQSKSEEYEKGITRLRSQ